LAQIVRVAEAEPAVSQRLTRSLGRDWATRLGELRTRVRNKVAHPGALLVADVTEVEPLWAACAFAEKALARLT
jgi:hypothetical protein